MKVGTLVKVIYVRDKKDFTEINSNGSKCIYKLLDSGVYFGRVKEVPVVRGHREDNRVILLANELEILDGHEIIASRVLSVSLEAILCEVEEDDEEYIQHTMKYEREISIFGLSESFEGQIKFVNNLLKLNHIDINTWLLYVDTIKYDFKKN